MMVPITPLLPVLHHLNVTELFSQCLCFGVQVDINPVVVPVYTESLRLCGNWLAETCLESPGVILENYLERV